MKLLVSRPFKIHDIDLPPSLSQTKGIIGVPHRRSKIKRVRKDEELSVHDTNSFFMNDIIR